MEMLISYIVAINTITLFLFWIDKINARKSSWRVPERQLFMFGLLGGGVGGIVGMRLFKHKTKQPRFTVGMPLIMLFNFGVYYFFWFILIKT